MGVALGHIGAEIGSGLAAGQLLQHHVGSVVPDPRSSHLGIEGRLNRVLNRGELGKAVLWEMVCQLIHYLSVGCVLRLRAKNGCGQRVIPCSIADIGKRTPRRIRPSGIELR